MENRYKKYYQLHKEELKQRAKEYRLLNKIVIADKKNKNYLRCRKNILKQKKEYLENNREEINERRRKNYPKYKQKRALGKKLWREKNRDKIGDFKELMEWHDKAGFLKKFLNTIINWPFKIFWKVIFLFKHGIPK